MNVPDWVGVPLMVMVFAAHDAVTPAGKPVGGPIPVAPVVVWVIVVSEVLIQSGGVDDAVLTVLLGVTVISIFAVAVNPFPSVTVTVYVVVAEGEATGFEIFVALKPAAGLHE